MIMYLNKDRVKWDSAKVGYALLKVAAVASKGTTCPLFNSVWGGWTLLKNTVSVLYVCTSLVYPCNSSALQQKSL